YRLGVQTYRAGLVKNPYHRDALYNLTGIAFVLNDTAKVLLLAQRLYAVDPMNRLSLTKLAGAWQLAGKKDSALYYISYAVFCLKKKNNFCSRPSGRWRCRNQSSTARVPASCA